MSTNGKEKRNTSINMAKIYPKTMEVIGLEAGDWSDREKMATRSKEEDLLLDQKIAQIRKKNEEILKRAKEVEEDKKLAREQNALVQLRPANIDDSRERTPALRPSSREFNKGMSETEDFPDANSRHPEMPNFRGRGGRGGYNRDRNDRKDGPPPDPRSFLADSERDPPTPRDGRGKTFTRSEETQRGNREFQRGGRRGSERGRSGGRGDRMYQRETREDAWRAERLRIDEARIQRQKTADGKWRREWDSDKIHEELNDDAKVGRGRGDARPAEQWKHSTHANSSPHINFDYSHGRGGSFRGGRGGRGGNSYYTDRGNMADGSFGHDMQCSHNNTPGSSDFDNVRGRGGGRSAPHNKNGTPVLRRTIPNSPTNSRNEKSIQDVDDTEIVVDSSKGTQHRSVKNVGDSLEVSIPNIQDERHNDRFTKDRRHGGRFSKHGKNSRSSYSSQSEDEMPKDKGYSKIKRDRVQFQNKQSHVASSHMADEKAEHIHSKNLEENIQSREIEDDNVQSSDKDVEGSEQLTNIENFGINIPKNQNPLPPFKTTSEVPLKIGEANNGEPESSEVGNSGVASNIKGSLIDNNVQHLENNAEQDATKANITVEKKPSSVENNVGEPKDSDDKVNSTINSGTVKVEQTNTIMRKCTETMDMTSEKDDIEIVTTEANIKDQQVTVKKPQENEIKTESPVATEKQETVGIEDVSPETKSEGKASSEVKSDPVALCDDSVAEKTNCTSQTNTEDKKALSENKQSIVNITETITANENVKSAE